MVWWIALANAGNSAEADSTYDQIPLRSVHLWQSPVQQSQRTLRVYERAKTQNIRAC